MKKITLRYDVIIDVIHQVTVLLLGEILAIYLWWRISTVADLRWNLTFWSVFLMFFGVSNLYIVYKNNKNAQKQATIYIRGNNVVVEFENQQVWNCTKYKITQPGLLYRIFDLCEIKLWNPRGKSIKIKNVSVFVKKYL